MSLNPFFPFSFEDFSATLAAPKEEKKEKVSSPELSSFQWILLILAVVVFLYMSFGWFVPDEEEYILEPPRTRANKWTPPRQKFQEQPPEESWWEWLW